MKFASMFSDVALSVFRKPFTEKYPFRRYDTPDRLRGCLGWEKEHCTGCGLCALDCPAQAIEMIVIDRKAKKYVVRYFLDRCTFCAQCVFSCRQGCLHMSNTNWELAALNHDTYCIYYGEQEDIQQILAD